MAQAYSSIEPLTTAPMETEFDTSNKCLEVPCFMRDTSAHQEGVTAHTGTVIQLMCTMTVAGLPEYLLRPSSVLSAQMSP